VFAVPLACEDFNDGDVDAPFAVIFQNSNYTPTTSAEKFVASPTDAADGVIHYFIPSGTNERQPFQIEIGAEDFTAWFGQAYSSEIYFEWYEYFAANYSWPTGSQKIIRNGYSNEGDSQDPERKESTLTIHGSNDWHQITTHCGVYGNPSLCEHDFFETEDVDFPVGQWVKMGAWYDWNNNFIRFYENDVLVLEITSDISQNTVKGANYAWIGGNYSMEGGVGGAANNSSRYINNLCVYATKPTDDGGGDTISETPISVLDTKRRRR